LVDSPIDLLGLYKTAVKNIRLNTSEIAVQESTWIHDFLDSEFGYPKDGIAQFESNSPYTFQSKNIKNREGLHGLKL
jgi:hypothetical protein